MTTLAGCSERIDTGGEGRSERSEKDTGGEGRSERIDTGGEGAQ